MVEPKISMSSNSLIFINVYDLPNLARCNRCTGVLGLGAYHTAIQVGRQEFTYGGNTLSSDSGIYMNAPRKNSSFVFKYSLPVLNPREPEESVLKMTEFEIVHCLLPQMSNKYLANQYDILLKNCNHFTDEFLTKITGGNFSLPGYMNRVAWIGSFFHCIVPNKYLTVTPSHTRENVIQDMNCESSRSTSRSYSLL